MKHRAPKLLAPMLLCAATGLGACTTPRPNAVLLEAPGFVPLEVRVQPLPGAKVRPPTPLPATLRRNSQGLITVQIPVKNPSSSPRNFRYSWQWVGPDGLSTSDPNRQVWRSEFIGGKDTFQLQSTSTVPDPSQVILRLSDVTP